MNLKVKKATKSSTKTFRPLILEFTAERMETMLHKTIHIGHLTYDYVRWFTEASSLILFIFINNTTK